MWVCLTGLLFIASFASAAVVFTEDFEGYGNTDDNTLATYDKFPPTPTDWVAANQGFGSDKAGLNLDGANTVYSFRYTNSGLTTDFGVIGSFAAGQTITVTFDSLADDGGSTGGTLQLATFNGGARNDGRNNTGTSGILASYNLATTGTGLSFSYVDDGSSSALYGHDLALRIKGASTSSNIDNFSVDVTAVPEASAALLGCLGALMLLRRRRA